MGSTRSGDGIDTVSTKGSTQSGEGKKGASQVRAAWGAALS
eukprot:gene16510-5047_t